MKKIKLNSGKEQVEIDTANSLTKKIIEHFNKNCLGYVWRNNAIPVRGRTFRGERGVGDIIGFLKDGRHIEFEIKIGKDKPRKEQILHEEVCKLNGAFYFFVETWIVYITIINLKGINYGVGLDDNVS